MRLLLLYIYILFFKINIFAQIKQEINANTLYYSTENGLPNNNVNFTFQDKYGYIWIGTNAGLSKYNGYQFKNLLPDPNQQNNIQVGRYISFLKISDTTYYLTTYSDGLVKLNIINNELVKIKNSPSSISTITKDNDATLWLGTFSAGFYHYFPKINKFEQTLLKPLINELYEDLENNTVTSILVDKTNESQLWLGTRIGLFSYNKSTKKMISYSVKNSLLQKEQAFNRIIAICADNAGNIWTGRLKGGGLGKFNIKTKQWENYLFNEEDANKKTFKSNTVLNIVLSNNTALILSTDIGLLSFNVLEKEFTKHHLKNAIEIDPFVNHLMIDKDSNWWISHHYGGLSYINSKLNAVKNYQLPAQKYMPDENGSVILDFYFSNRYQKYFMLNTNHDGLTIYDKDFKLSEQVTLPNYLENREPYPISMAEDNEGLIWINEYSDKLFVYNPLKKEVKNYEHPAFKNCYQIYRSNNDYIYFKTDVGLYSLKNHKWNLEIDGHFDGEKNNNLTSIGWVSNIKKSYLLVEISTDSIFRFDLISKKMAFELKLPEFATKNGNHIWQIYIDAKERIWFPMELGGVYKYDLKTKKGIIYAAQKGLSSNTAQLVKEDKNGTVFLIGRNGLYYYNETQDRFIDFANLSNIEKENWFRECLFFTEDDKMLLCRINDFSIVDKNLVLKNNSNTATMLSSVYGNNFEFYNLFNQIIVPNYENDITLVLSNFNYSYISELVYSYKIDNENWKNLNKGQNLISLNNLSEGKHLLSYKILGEKKVETFTIRIKVIWHKSKYFYWAIGLFLLFISAYFIWFYINRKNKENALQKRLAELKLISLQSQLNPHFLFNCLASISGLIKIKEYDKSEKILNDFAKLMRSILTNSSKDLISLEEELKISKLYLEIEKVRKDNTFDYVININENLLQNMVPPLILQPFLENCIKHGFSSKTKDDSGLITINFSKDIAGFQIKITDNGLGLIEKYNGFSSHQPMGIAIQKERMLQYAKTHNLFIDIKTDFIENEGATILITFL